MAHPFWSAAAAGALVLAGCAADRGARETQETRPPASETAGVRGVSDAACQPEKAEPGGEPGTGGSGPGPGGAEDVTPEATPCPPQPHIDVTDHVTP